MTRIDGRQLDEKRAVKITRNYIMHPDGSVLIEMGNTKVICTAMIEEKAPPFLKGEGKGWITAEYGMLPGSTMTRKRRPINKVDGRSQEIQRLIGRALRSVVKLEALGERTISIDCDVIQADGGTRTAAITGSFIAMVDAIQKLIDQNLIESSPVQSYLSAISVGIVDGEAMLDLCYEEDSSAKVDMNVIMTDDGKIVEIQGTGEESPFSKEEMMQLLALAEKGNQELIAVQKEILGDC